MLMPLARKVQTVKDLRQILDHLKSQRLANPTQDPTEPVYDESNTVLLDDSPLKAILQPWSQIVIPEYDEVEFHLSKLAAAALSQDPTASHEGLDEILLGVIGILEALREVQNVPAWVRAGGGLVSDLDDKGMANVQDVAELDLNAEPMLESLPSHKTFIHWYTESAIAEYWKAKGVEALRRKGIKLEIGKIEGAGELNSAPNSPMPGSPARAYRSEWSHLGESSISGERSAESEGIEAKPSPRRRTRRYTPSAPVGEDGPNGAIEDVETPTVIPRDTSRNKYLPRPLRPLSTDAELNSKHLSHPR